MTSPSSLMPMSPFLLDWFSSSSSSSITSPLLLLLLLFSKRSMVSKSDSPFTRPPPSNVVVVVVVVLPSASETNTSLLLLLLVPRNPRNDHFLFWRGVVSAALSDGPFVGTTSCLSSSFSSWSSPCATGNVGPRLLLVILLAKRPFMSKRSSGFALLWLSVKKSRSKPLPFTLTSPRTLRMASIWRTES